MSRVIFAAPLSPLTHNVFASAPSRSWLATGECGRVCFLANTPHDWRYAVVQAVHELAEAALHRFENITQARIDADDLTALTLDRPTSDRAHSVAVSLETQLALALGVDFTYYSRVTRGIHAPPLGAALRQHP